MTSVACLVTRQIGVSPSKMNIGRSRFAGSLSLFLWAGPTASVIICFKPKCQTSLLVSLSAYLAQTSAPTSTKTQNGNSVIQCRFNEPLLYFRQAIKKRYVAFF